MKIFLDPGHGGNNPGARSETGLKEAFVNLDVALKLGRLLVSWGYEVMYSRTEDVSVSLERRANMANQWGANYFVSIHCNSSVYTYANGTETFYYRPGTTSERFALTVNNALVRQIELTNNGISAADFAVLRLTNMPAILVEMAFISNPSEGQLLSTNAFRQNCAIGIANGIAEFTQ